MVLFNRLTRIGYLFAVMFVAGALPGHAERILFQRGEVLYVASLAGNEVRRLFTIGKPFRAVWAPSPDGHRLAWYAPVKPGSSSDQPQHGLKAQPIALWISDLSGQRRKILLTTDNVRDRLGRQVTEVWIGRSRTIADWLPLSLAWGPGSKNLYISCAYQGSTRERATFIVDATTGTAVVDAQGRWKSIAPATEVDTRWPLLVGVGLGQANVDLQNPSNLFFPLFVVNLTQAKTIPLMTFPFEGTPPSYRLAAAPAFSPDGKTIAFTAIGDGLWLVDPEGKEYRRLTDNRADDAPRWSEGGNRIYFLSSVTRGASVSTDLYEMDMSPSFPTERRLLIKDVARFNLIPD